MSRETVITTKDLYFLKNAPGAAADFTVRGSDGHRLFKLERLGYLRVVFSFNPHHYSANSTGWVKVYTLTEKGAELIERRGAPRVEGEDVVRLPL